MGCLWEIEAYAQEGGDSALALEGALDEVDRLDRLLSHYRPDSQVSRLNREAAAGPAGVDPELFALIRTSLEYSRTWDGAFDITVGPLMRAWGFFRSEGRVPDASTLEATRARVGFRHVRTDPERQTVAFDVEGVQLDFGAIGKGYAADRAADVLRSAGVESALVNGCGSTMAAIGAPPGASGWEIPVRDPLRRDAIAMHVTLRDRTLSVSGGAEQAFESGGARYSHIMDPRTGRPVTGMLMVAVLAPTATEGDALSTAVFVAGPAESRRRLAGASGIEAHLFVPAGDGWRTIRLGVAAYREDPGAFRRSTTANRPICGIENSVKPSTTATSSSAVCSTPSTYAASGS